MTELSPAAQAILKAAYKATRNPNWQTNFYTSYAAAVLRAAALYCKRDRLQLLTIAEELEAQ